MNAQPARTGVKPIGVEPLLRSGQFAVQKAQLEPPGHIGDDWNRPGNYGTDRTILQRHLMGATIDGGRGYIPDAVHDDAEAVTAVVCGALDWRIATWVAELARAGLTPDWMQGAVSNCVPRGTVQNRHGITAKTAVAVKTHWPGGWGAFLPERRGKRVVNFECRLCPVTFEPSEQRIQSARRAYLDWWWALDAVRESLRVGKVLRAHQITRHMPPPEPWEKEMKP